VTAVTASLNLAIEAGTVSATVTIGGEEVTAIVDGLSEADVDGIVELLSASTTFQPVGVVAALTIVLLAVAWV
jgi:hypothetical protein